MLKSPGQTLDGLIFLCKASDPLSPEGQQLSQIINLSFEKMKNDFTNGDGNQRAYMVAKLVEKVVFALIGTKGVKAAFDGMKAAAESGQLAINIEKLSKGLMTADDVANVIAKTAEAVSKLKAAMKTSAAELNKLITKVYSRTNGVVDVEFAGIGEIKLNESQILGDADQIAKDRYTKFIESKLSEGAAEAASRLSTRVLDEIADSAIVSRVKEIRGLLPSDLKRSGNFGLAKVKISGIKNELYAHSGIDVLSDARSAASNVADITLKPTNPIFKATSVPTSDGTMLFRDMDTEYKILNNIAETLGDNTSISGKITLFTERPCCDSCSNVISEFLQKYKNITIEVIHNNGTLLRP